MLGIREFDGPSNFEVYWSVPPSVSQLLNQQLSRPVPSGHRQEKPSSCLALPIDGALSVHIFPWAKN
jgi:hypothetical protein